MKNGTISSRASIVQRSKGQSAVEQSAYISRTLLNILIKHVSVADAANVAIEFIEELDEFH